jgi:hypothetical protein
MRLSYPDMRDDLEREIAEHLAQQARANLNPSDVLAEVQSLLLQISEDTQHPLWRVVRDCVVNGTVRETGRDPYSVETVGEALMPWIERAIAKLVQQALDVAWEGPT